MCRKNRHSTYSKYRYLAKLHRKNIVLIEGERKRIERSLVTDLMTTIE
jgi:hypothetical protein